MDHLGVAKDSKSSPISVQLERSNSGEVYPNMLVMTMFQLRAWLHPWPSPHLKSASSYEKSRVCACSTFREFQKLHPDMTPIHCERPNLFILCIISSIVGFLVSFLVTFLVSFHLSLNYLQSCQQSTHRNGVVELLTWAGTSIGTIVVAVAGATFAVVSLVPLPLQTQN